MIKRCTMEQIEKLLSLVQTKVRAKRSDRTSKFTILGRYEDGRLSRYDQQVSDKDPLQDVLKSMSVFSLESFEVLLSGDDSPTKHIFFCKKSSDEGVWLLGYIDKD